MTQMTQMTERFRITRLPVVDARVPGGVEERAVSDRGEFTFLVNGSELKSESESESRPVGLVAWVTFPLGGVRANHVHHRRTETLYITTGLLEGRYRDLDTGVCWLRNVEAGDLIVVGPRIAHAYRALRYSQAIEVADTPWDPEDVEVVDLYGDDWRGA